MGGLSGCEPGLVMQQALENRRPLPSASLTLRALASMPAARPFSSLMPSASKWPFSLRRWVRPADVAHEEIGNCHARVGRLRLVADESDVRLRVRLAQRLRRDHPGRTVSHDDVFHNSTSDKNAKAPAAPVALAVWGKGYSPSRFVVSLVGTPSVVQPRTL